MSFDSKLQRIFSDHIEQMSKDLDKISNGEEKLVFKIYDRNILISICEKVSELFKKEPIVLDLKGDCIVVGDLHGHILDLYRIFTVFDLPPKTTYLFLGDIVDRGGFSVETITLLFVLKLLYPSNIYIIRGNHEFNASSEKQKEFNSLDLKHINSFIDQISNIYEQRNHMLPQKKYHNVSILPKKKLEPISEQQDLENLNMNESLHSSYGIPVHLMLNSRSFHSMSNGNRSADNEGNSINHSNSLSNDKNSTPKAKSDCSAERNFPNVLPKKVKPNRSLNGYTNRLYISFCSAFSYIPIAARFGRDILCIHGGIGGNFTSIEKDIVPIQRPINNYDNAIIENLLWSDPMPPEKEKEYKNLNYMTSPRGRGCIFGKSPLDSFMKANHLSLIIRAHEVVDSGIRLQFNNKLITVFSASSYINSYNNNSGVLKISRDNKVTTYSFPPFKFLQRESASFILNNNKNIANKLSFTSSSSFLSSASSTASINCTDSNFSGNFDIPNVEDVNNADENKNNASSNVDNNNNNNNECYTIDNFYNVNTSNNINGSKANNDKNSITKIISKTIISNDRKQNFPSSELSRNQDQIHNSTRRRIKFDSKNVKKSSLKTTPVPTFS